MIDTGNTMQKENQHSTDNVNVFRVYSSGSIEHTCDNVITEQPVTIMIDRVGSFTVMCTPSDIEALAIGFIFSEGMINSIDDVVETYTKPELPNVIGIEVQDPTKISIGRNLIVASSCGMCGVRNIEKMIQTIQPCEQTFKVTDHLLVETMQKLRSLQNIFDLTGGSHSAAIFDSSSEIISFAEDIGRHNALDKAIGKCLLTGRTPQGCGVALSGRVSLEIVTKAAKAGIELIAAVSAVSSYAVSVSEKWNITLCGFVRLDKMNVYTKPDRIINHNEQQYRAFV
ncbi:formate dehydrogenase accessory sulfurtransferase FdhD [Planctomycetota bacterium]